MRATPLLPVGVAARVEGDDRVATTNAYLQTAGFEETPIPEQASEPAAVASSDGISSRSFDVRGSTPSEAELRDVDAVL